MRKKNFCIMMGVCILSTVLYACKSGESKDDSNSVANDVAITEAAENVSENVTENVTDNTVDSDNLVSDDYIYKDELPSDAKFIYESAQYELGTVNIKYPVILVEGQEQVAYTSIHAINEIIKDDALSILTNYSINDGTDSVNVDYSIFIDGDGNISVKFSGDAMYSNAAHPSVLEYTSNVNVYSGTRFKPISDDKLSQITAHFEVGKDYEVCSDETDIKEAVEDYLREYDMSMLASELNNMDFDDDRQTPYTYSYQDEDGVYIIISVPTAIGQYAILKIIE